MCIYLLRQNFKVLVGELAVRRKTIKNQLFSKPGNSIGLVNQYYPLTMDFLDS